MVPQSVMSVRVISHSSLLMVPQSVMSVRVISHERVHYSWSLKVSCQSSQSLKVYFAHGYALKVLCAFPFFFTLSFGRVISGKNDVM